MLKAKVNRLAGKLNLLKETSQELRMLSRSLSDCKSLHLNVMIQVSRFASNRQLCRHKAILGVGCNMPIHMKHVSMIHACVMQVKNGDEGTNGRTNGKLNSRSKIKYSLFPLCIISFLISFLQLLLLLWRGLRAF